MYHTKKIGIFISHLFGYYQKHVCQGIIDKALEYGYTAEIYTSMDGEDLGAYGIGEESILRVPNYNSLDGIIFASDTYPSTDLKNKILRKLQKKCTCPIIEVAETETSFPSIRLENNNTTIHLTEHLITEHGYKRICYLGCEEESYFSDWRENYFRSTMEKHHRTIGSHDVYTAAYSTDSVTSALAFFEKKGCPEAVVCYNDRMARLFMIAALSSGYRIPEDIAITGCDDSVEGQNINPPLTTVSFPVYELGTTAVEQLIHLLHNELVEPVTTIQASPIYRCSCGCTKSTAVNPIFYEQALTERIDSLEESIFKSMHMSASFQGITDLDAGMDLLVTYIEQISHCRECYLCLYPDWDAISGHILALTDQEADETDTDSILLALAWRDGKRLPQCSFQKNYTLPEHIYHDSDCAYIFTPLFFGKKEFGYLTLAYEKNLIDYHFQMVHWTMNLSQFLQALCDARRTGLLVNRLESIYTKDALTGLLNKHGYLAQEPFLLSQAAQRHTNVTAFFFDLDCLKQINDNFGHSEGDFALQVIGHAIENATKEGDICARFSGDEFYVLTMGYSSQDEVDLIRNVQKYLDHYNQLSSKPYLVSISAGCASIHCDTQATPEQIEQLFKAADQKMYAQKTSKEKHVFRDESL